MDSGSAELRLAREIACWKALQAIKPPVNAIGASASFLTSCRESGRTTPGSDKVMLVSVKAGNDLSLP